MGVKAGKDTPIIFIRAAYQTTIKTAELFLEIADKPGFRSEQSMKFAIVPDGKMRTYEVQLFSSPTYRGAIMRLRFDPVETGMPSETMEVELISTKKD